MQRRDRGGSIGMASPMVPSMWAMRLIVQLLIMATYVVNGDAGIEVIKTGEDIDNIRMVEDMGNSEEWAWVIENTRVRSHGSFYRLVQHGHHHQQQHNDNSIGAKPNPPNGDGNANGDDNGVGTGEGLMKKKNTKQGKLANGLSWDFYHETCPELHHVVAEAVRSRTRISPGEPAGLLRLLFHDCFVQGCDASILLDGSLSELNFPPNRASIRDSSIKLIGKIKENLEAQCPGIISCADIIVLAAREAIFLAGGPLIPMPLGRRDSHKPAPSNIVAMSLPSPFDNFATLRTHFAKEGLGIEDLVALSGGHSIGEAHCSIVDTQLVPKVSEDLDLSFVHNISKVCLPVNSKLDQTIHLDFVSKNKLDNNYFKNILAKRVLFHSDAALLQNPKSSELVKLYAQSEESFFNQFALSIQKLSQVQVLTGTKGEIRNECNISN